MSFFLLFLIDIDIDIADRAGRFKAIQVNDELIITYQHLTAGFCSCRPYCNRKSKYFNILMRSPLPYPQILTTIFSDYLLYIPPQRQLAYYENTYYEDTYYEYTYDEYTYDEYTYDEYTDQIP